MTLRLTRLRHFLFVVFKRMSTKRKRSSFASDLVLARPFTPPRKRVYAPRARAISGRRSDAYTGELKFHDVSLDDAVIAAGGVITATTIIIPQGITEKTRIGRKCTIRSIHWKYRLQLPAVDAAGTGNLNDVIRVIVYVDKQCNGAAATATDLLETAAVQSFRNLTNSGRFTFLLDKIYPLNYTTLMSDGAGLASQNQVTREYLFNKKCNIPIEYSAAAGTIDEIRSNNIGVLLQGRSGIAEIASEFRFRFSDN